MISEIERGGRVPTVPVLDRIATALDTSIARLLGTERDFAAVHLRAADQDVAIDPSGWQRRILSPVLPGIEFEFMRTTINPGVDAGVFLPHAAGSREYVAVEAGTLLLTLDGTDMELATGDSVFFPGDCHHGFANPGRRRCVYYLVMDLVSSTNAEHRKVVT
jgi:quercetin dioxygenase-like cupin family protein